MIIVTECRKDISNIRNELLCCPKVFSADIITHVTHHMKPTNLLSLSVGLALLTGKLYKPECPRIHGSVSCIITKKTQYTSPDDPDMTMHLDIGTVLLFGAEYTKNKKYTYPTDSIIMYEYYYSPIIYLTTCNRIDYARHICDKLTPIRRLGSWSQLLFSYFPFHLIGNGSFGKVYKCVAEHHDFAVKNVLIKPDAISSLYDPSYSSWHEVFYLQTIIRPLIQRKVCPNLPLLYDTFTYKELNPITREMDCVLSMLTELAQGSLRQYLEQRRSMAELHSCLFQVMVALYSLQYHAQLIHFDIKKENVLVYDVEPGGYWKYVIRGKNYYVPNYGQMFVLNDFGTSRILSPTHEVYKNKDELTYRLGSRFAFVKNGKFSPFNTWNQVRNSGKEEIASKIVWEGGKVSMGAEFRKIRKGSVIPLNVMQTEKMKRYLQTKTVPTDFHSLEIFNYPDIIPPFEFYNDTQDVIRMFVGGKRTTQKGNHKFMTTIPKKFLNQLHRYTGKAECMKDYCFSFDPAQVMAGYFITDFFDRYTKYNQVPKGMECIGEYIVSR